MTSRRLRSHSAYCRAFTLLELLVVIGIIGLLFGLAGLAVTSLAKSNGLNTGGRVLANLLTVARSEAINQRRLVQVRVATKWTVASGNEDTSASYRKFSVWRRPQPEDAQQSADPADPYIQVSNWETLPTGIAFEKDPAAYNFPAATTDAKYPGKHFLDASLGNRKSGVKAATATVEVAWIEFTPGGGTHFTAAVPGRVYVLLTEGFWDGTYVTPSRNRVNWLATTVDTLVGRVNVLRP